MSPLSGFLAVIVFFTAILVAYLTKQFQNENLNYLISNPMTNSNPKVKTIEKEKVVAETLNGSILRFSIFAHTNNWRDRDCCSTGCIFSSLQKVLQFSI